MVITDNTLRDCLWKATSGKGIVNLHHTITFYALEHVRRNTHLALVSGQGAWEEKCLHDTNRLASCYCGSNTRLPIFAVLDESAATGMAFIELIRETRDAGVL